jgi:putative peptidoglycan binding protein
VTVTRGAWLKGHYQRGLSGTLGESMDSDSDNLGWTLRSWKYELDYNGFRGRMVLDEPSFGDAMDHEVRAFQDKQGLIVDGILGPATGRALLQQRTFSVVANMWRPPGLLDQCLRDTRGIIQHESAYDVGAIGYVDSGDRGCTQVHVYTSSGPSINLSQAIRPALAIPRLVAQLVRLTHDYDADAAVVSWNCGEGGAQWWYENGKPTTGSPSWWPGPEPLGQRATEYLAAVRAAR